MTDTSTPIFPVLAGKVAIITGGAKGMGKVTASVFLRAGANVVIADVLETEGLAAVEALKLECAPGQRDGSGRVPISFIRADISKSDEVKNMVDRTVEAFGRLDVAVNNAAMMPDSTPLADMDEDYWEKVMGVNVTGTALCCKYEMRAMMDGGIRGSIVNIASINAFKPQPNVPAYTTSKHALLGITRHAALEGGPHGIRVNSIAPGPIRSEFMNAGLEAIGTTEEEFAQRMSYLGRFGEAVEVAQGSLWLCSGASSYVTGTCLSIDGGALVK